MPNTIQRRETVAQQPANKDIGNVFSGLISAITVMNDWTLPPGDFQKRNEKDGSTIIRAEFIDNSKNKKAKHFLLNCGEISTAGSVTEKSDCF